MHETSALWKQIFAEPDHRKEVKVTINGVEYNPEDDRLIRASISGSLFDAPSVGGAVSRTLELELVPWDGGVFPPMSEIRLFVRLVSSDGQRVSEYIPKGVFYSDTVRRDRDTGAVTVTAFDSIMKMERMFSDAVCRIVFDDGYGGIQRFVLEIGDPMPTPTTPTHTGLNFAAWRPNPSATAAVVRDMRFIAQWTNIFTVIFDSGDGEPQTFSCVYGSPTPTPTAPTKSGYVFTGWSPAPAATVTENATYTAQWAGITVKALPTKTTYKPGDKLDYAGLIVVFSGNGAEIDITSDCEFSPEEGQTVEWEEA